MADIPDNPEDFRQCIACNYICSDGRVWNENPPWPCPSCKRLGHWSNDVDWATREAALAEVARLGQEIESD